MSNQNITETVAAKVEAFKEFISIGTTPGDLRKVLTSIYFNYTRLINRTGEQASEKELFYLSEIIGILEDGEV
ncbi:MAG TPA: hypothetical protein VL442_12860 [Mucilaginibacter sp.]|jgi:hypothetical protein|nr:hypothetical protein [Mucilaginibacter sp.]